jgi:hypothetical protein
LRYNFYPARIFMGDTGSMFLGYMVAVIGLISTNKVATFSSVLVPILAAGVPIFDVFLAIWRRITRQILHRRENGTSGSRVMEGDREHLHHRILDQNQNQRKTTLIMYGVASLFALIALGMVALQQDAQGLAFLIVLIAFVTAIRRLATVELWNSARVLVDGMHRPQKTLLVMLTHPFLDTFILGASFLLTEYLMAKTPLPRDFWKVSVFAMIYNILPVIVILQLGRTYRRVWILASSMDYLRLFELMLIGHLVNVGVHYFQASGNIGKAWFVQHILFFLFSTFLILAERMMLRYVRTTLIGQLRMDQRKSLTTARAVIYGFGIRCRFYLIDKRSHLTKDPVKVVGIITNNKTLRGQYVYGYKVLGCPDEIQEIHEKIRFDRIVLADPGADEDKRLPELLKFCHEHAIKVTRLNFGETEVTGG